MNTEIRTNPKGNKFWDDMLHWMKALDEAVDYDPHDAIYGKLQLLETRINQLERASINTDGKTNLIRQKVGGLQ
ncbi:MAG: hypothetical protein ABJH63_16795 [Rhizobiaceae bacterium]